MSKAAAVIEVETVIVSCPECGEPQPNPDDGGDAWTTNDVRRACPDRQCVACDHTFKILGLPSKVPVRA